MCLVQDSDQTSILSSADTNTWILYTSIAAAILIFLIIAILLYDLCSRCCKHKEQVISDGGPPASPSHLNSYSVTLRVNEASLNFDSKTTVLRLELLNSLNQFLTSVAIPCFILKFKTPNQDTLKLDLDVQQDEKAFHTQQFRQLQQYQNMLLQSDIDNGHLDKCFKSLSGLHEIWSNTVPSSTITFKLICRMPLRDFSSVRVSHDCYNPGAFVSLRCLSVKEDMSGMVAQVSFRDRSISAYHPCPASGSNVYTIAGGIKR